MKNFLKTAETKKFQKAGRNIVGLVGFGLGKKLVEELFQDQPDFLSLPVEVAQLKQARDIATPQLSQAPEGVGCKGGAEHQKRSKGNNL